MNILNICNRIDKKRKFLCVIVNIIIDCHFKKQPMQNYDFLILSPYEFENISRDLLQKKLSVYIESFTSGRDGGTDLRYTVDKTKTITVQSKRYKEYASLLSILKKEVLKVKLLNPTNYILTTSVGLTPDNKTEILTLFSPFIKQPEDIIGKDDLNNLLGIYKDIEHKYYKLWLSSSVVLERVLHSKIYNQSAFELEEIKSQLGLYVQNSSFSDAIKILNKNRYVIISGIPGIGKTTLARVIIFALLSNEFEEFIYLSDNIDDAYTFYSEGKKQVFFFDDFLGRNFFDSKGIQNNDNKIVKFIEKVKKSNDKFLILATREYILNQAKIVFESFNIHNIEMAKCVLDLSTYTNVIKAQILYNHLFFSSVPSEYLSDLLTNKNYLNLIKHRNFNPRIIETIINRKIWEHCKPNDFSKALKTFFDNPESVWVYAFENSLDKFSQYSLLTLLTLGTPVLIDDLEIAIQEFLNVNNYKYLTAFDSIIFRRALRELENTFIKTQKDSYNNFVVEYQNPSIQDFLVNYLKDKKDLVNSLIQSLKFNEQFFTIFTKEAANLDTNRKIFLDSDQIENIISRLVNIFDELKCAEVLRLKKENSENFSWSRNSSYYYIFLLKTLKEFPNYINIEKLIYEKLKIKLYINDLSSFEQEAYIELISKLDLSRLEINKEQAINSLVSNLTRIRNFEIFSNIKEIFPNEFNKLIITDEFKNKIDKIVNQEMESVEGSDLDSLKIDLENLEELYNLQFPNEIAELERRELDYENYLDSQAESYMEDHKGEATMNAYEKEEEIINEMYKSFVE